MAIRDGFAGALGYTLLIRLCRASEATGLSPVLLLFPPAWVRQREPRAFFDQRQVTG